MCGIVGMAGDMAHKHNAMFSHMLFFCQLRGRDSTGVFAVKNKKGEFDYTKQVGTPDVLMSMKSYDRVVSAYSSRAIIGHCRHKTIGNISRHTAHPFWEGEIIGVHNGTLRNWEKFGRDYSVDSNALFFALSEVDDPKEVLEQVEGAYALIWYDARNDLLNLARNKERPLIYAHSKDRRQVFWASELWMIEVAAQKADVELATDDKGHQFFNVPVGRLISMELASSGANPIRIVRDEEFVVKESAYATNTYYSNNHAGGFHSKGVNDPPKNNVPSKVIAAPAGGQVVPFVVPPAQQAPPDAQITQKPSKPLPSQQRDILSCTTKTSPESKSSVVSLHPSKGGGSDVQRKFWEALESKNDFDTEEEEEERLFANEAKGPKGALVGEARFLELVEDGCQWCQKSIDFHEEKSGRGVGMWLHHGFICKECTPSAIEQRSMRAAAN